MDEEKNPRDIAGAFSAFAKKFRKFSQQENPENPVIKNPDDLLQQQINEKEEAFRNSVCGSYKKYKDHLGQIAVEEDSIAKCYELNKSFCEGAKSAASGSGDNSLSIHFMSFKSCVCFNTNYTEGNSLIYLMCYLKFEKKYEEYVPVFVTDSASGRPYLSFVESSQYDFTSSQKEIMGIVKDNFYA